ncbi:MAG: ROK family protein [Candidatus Adiutrix sp.]|nr:ROK family protein [Candidatus Adiutrix sp.]
MTKRYLALDVGGTNITAGLVDQEGLVLARRAFATLAGRPPKDVINDMAAHLRAVATESSAGPPPRALAVGLPGWINQERGLLIQAPNVPGWVNVPMADIMSRMLGLPVCLENDGNLYALGEWLYGAGQGLNNLLVVTLGTGVGGGLILEKKLWNGSFASAVEIGHMPIDLKGAICGCGRRGCLETVASATGLRRLGVEWLAAGRPTGYLGRPEDLTPIILYALAQKGDEMALTIFQKAGQSLGLVLSGVVNLLGLEGVVIGGGVAGALEFIRPALWDVLARRVIIAAPEKIRLLKGLLGEDAPLAGAAALLRERF